MAQYFLIRHKATGEIMPQAKRRGYSHWNPAKPEHTFKQGLTTPRLLVSESQAKRVISQWVALPNGRQSSYQTYAGEWDDIVDFTDDGRKKEDLEIITANLEVINA